MKTAAAYKKSDGGLTPEPSAHCELKLHGKTTSSAWQKYRCPLLSIATVIIAWYTFKLVYTSSFLIDDIYEVNTDIRGQYTSEKFTIRYRQVM